MLVCVTVAKNRQNRKKIKDFRTLGFSNGRLGIGSWSSASC